MSAGSAASQSIDKHLGAGWEPGPLAPMLWPGCLHVWRVDLPTVGDRLVELLSEDECERAQRIVGARQRRLWSGSRGVLRALLGRYLQRDPRTVRFQTGAHGKPSLHEPRGGGGLSFNLSHSRTLALYAFGESRPVGVDVQLLRAPDSRSTNDYVALARRTFGEERARRLHELEPERREREFLRLWTRYEAELKRLGSGIGGGQRGVDPDTPWIAELELGARAAAAVACAEEPSELLLWDWVDDAAAPGQGGPA